MIRLSSCSKILDITEMLISILYSLHNTYMLYQNMPFFVFFSKFARYYSLTIYMYIDFTNFIKVRSRSSTSNHRHFDCLLNRLIWCISNQTSKLCVIGLYEGDPPVTGGLPWEKASNGEMFPFDDAIIFIKYSSTNGFHRRSLHTYMIFICDPGNVFVHQFCIVMRSSHDFTHEPIA